MLPGVVCDESQAPDHPFLKVTKMSAKPFRPRNVFCFTGVSVTNNFLVYHQTLTALVRAIKERVFYVKYDDEFLEPKRPDRAFVFEELSSVFIRLKRKAQYTTPMQARQFAESYQGRRRAVYLEACEKNVQLGFFSYLSKIKAFVKTEKYNFTNKIPVPRIIQPRDPRYLVETGRYHKPIEKKIYGGINDLYGEVTVFKGMNAQRRGVEAYKKWCLYKDPVAVGLDAKRFDQHVSNAMLEWEHAVYQLFYRGDKYFKWLCSLQRNNQAVSYVEGHKVTYHTMHNRASGDTNTSLGNVLIVCSIILLLRDRFRFSLMNDGDDCVIICNKSDLMEILSVIPDHFRSFGFEMEIEKPVDIFERIEFCQCHPILDNTGNYVMVRKPSVTVSKDAVAIKPLTTPLLTERWLAAVGEGGMKLCKGIPVMQAYYEMFLRNSHGTEPLKDPTLEGGFWRLSIGMDFRNTTITPETRASFYWATNIPPAAQICVEKYYHNHTFTQGDSQHRFTNLPL